MKVRDFNGSGNWSADAILKRYDEYSVAMGICDKLDLRPMKVQEGEKTWIYPVMSKVIPGIKKGDPACIRLGVEFLEEDKKFFWGANLKSQVARALKSQRIDEDLKERLRSRFTLMLIHGNVPREYRYYVRLLRMLGFESHWREIELGIDRKNKYVMRHFKYLEAVHVKSASVFRTEG